MPDIILESSALASGIRKMTAMALYLAGPGCIQESAVLREKHHHDHNTLAWKPHNTRSEASGYSGEECRGLLATQQASLELAWEEGLYT